MVELGDLSGGTYNGIARGVSGDGNVVVGESNATAGTRAYQVDASRRHGAAPVDLAHDHRRQRASAPNADGSLITSAAPTARRSSGPTPWRAGCRRSPTPAGLSGAASALDISADGRLIVGFAGGTWLDAQAASSTTPRRRQPHAQGFPDRQRRGPGRHERLGNCAGANAISADGRTIVGIRRRGGVARPGPAGVRRRRAPSPPLSPQPPSRPH
jgi:uncharacterized membrane protein